MMKIMKTYSNWCSKSLPKKKQKNISTYQQSEGPGAEGFGAGTLLFKWLSYFLQRTNWWDVGLEEGMCQFLFE